jgi:hypothetical protein
MGSWFKDYVVGLLSLSLNLGLRVLGFYAVSFRFRVYGKGLGFRFQS